MDVVLANHSTYPGTATEAEFSRVLREQADAGLDLITDGQLDWPDPIASLLACFDGVRLDSREIWVHEGTVSRGSGGRILPANDREIILADDANRAAGR